MRIPRARTMFGAPLLVAVSVVLLAALTVPTPAPAQQVTQRTPNLSGGWVASPGALHFNFNHRFWLVQGRRIVNSPSFLLAAPLPGNTLVGLQFASNSLVAEGEFNEWELQARWAFLDGAGGAGGAGGGAESGSPAWRSLEAAVTGAYNPTIGSADAELALVLPVRSARLVGSGRVFSNAFDGGDPGWFAGGGVVIPVRDAVSLAGDGGIFWRNGEREGTAVWGAGLQLHIPTTPHTLSIQASNTKTATLQGSATGFRTVWGFEFTIPFTFARYFRGARPGPPEAPEEDAPRPPGEVDARERTEVEVTMDDDMRFVPGTIRIRAGQTVIWRNDGQVVHTVTAHPDRVRDPEMIALPAGAEPFDSGNMFSGDVFRHTFTVPGEYVYLCIPHDMAGMIGRVIVEE